MFPSFSSITSEGPCTEGVCVYICRHALIFTWSLNSPRNYKLLPRGQLGLAVKNCKRLPLTPNICSPHPKPLEVCKCECLAGSSCSLADAVSAFLWKRAPAGCFSLEDMNHLADSSCRPPYFCFFFLCVFCFGVEGLILKGESIRVAWIISVSTICICRAADVPGENEVLSVWFMTQLFKLTIGSLNKCCWQIYGSFIKINA